MKYLYFIIFILSAVQCNRPKNIDNIDSVTSNKSFVLSLDEFISEIEKNNSEKCIVIDGNDENSQIVEYFFQNYRPFLYKKNEGAERMKNQQVISKKYGFFKYKNFDIFITEKLKNQFKIEFKEGTDLLDYFIYKDEIPTKREIEEVKLKCMLININKSDNKVISKKIFTL